MVPISITSPGTYCFTAGATYNTQITITSSSVTLESTGGHQQATIEPTSVVQNSADPDTTTPEYNIILAGGSSITGVTITNLVVDGSLLPAFFTSAGFSCGLPITGDPFDYEGVLFLNAGGTITGNTVQNVYLPLGSAGCQPGNAVEVQTGVSLSSTVVISNNQVLNYNKNGITCNDVGTTCTITKNTVSFYSAYTDYIAPNGIQIGFGAVGTVSDNTVSGNECNVPTTCGSDYVTQTQSAGILTYESGAGTRVSGNTVSGNDIGILTSSDAVMSTNNVVQNNRYEGMYLNDGTYTASNNRISGSLVGIAIVSDGFVANPTSATLLGNNFKGSFSTAPIQVTAYNDAPSGNSFAGTNVEPATVTLTGFTETVTSGLLAPLDIPSFVNITPTS